METDDWSILFAPRPRPTRNGVRRAEAALDALEAPPQRPASAFG